jgi:hypothetical protein
LSRVICVKEYLNLQYLITNIIIKYSEIIIENNYNKEKCIIILNHITVTNVEEKCIIIQWKCIIIFKYIILYDQSRK